MKRLLFIYLHYIYHFPIILSAYIQYIFNFIRDKYVHLGVEAPMYALSTFSLHVSFNLFFHLVFYIL